MYPSEDSICGLIEFAPSEARLAMRTRYGSDETVQATLASLAQDILHDGAENDDDDWASETEVFADVESLEHDLLLIYRRIQRRLG